MKLGGNRPPGDNPILFSISGTGSFICGACENNFCSAYSVRPSRIHSVIFILIGGVYRICGSHQGLNPFTVILFHRKIKIMFIWAIIKCSTSCYIVPVINVVSQPSLGPITAPPPRPPAHPPTHPLCHLYTYIK